MGKSNKNIVTIEQKDGIVCLNGYASESCAIYVGVLVEVCRRRKIDPRDALVNTDSYPELGRSREVEFAIGWIHGCAEAHEVLAEDLYDAVMALEPKVGGLKNSGQIAGKKKRPAQKVTPIAKRRVA